MPQLGATLCCRVGSAPAPGSSLSLSPSLLPGPCLGPCESCGFPSQHPLGRACGQPRSFLPPQQSCSRWSTGPAGSLFLSSLRWGHVLEELSASGPAPIPTIPFLSWGRTLWASLRGPRRFIGDTWGVLSRPHHHLWSCTGVPNGQLPLSSAAPPARPVARPPPPLPPGRAAAAGLS